MPRSDSASYLSNPRLKRAGVNIPITMKELQEYQKCLADPIYFIRNYVKIVHVDRGEILFNMWDFQEKMIRLFLGNRFCIVKMPRQVGKSVTTIAYILHTILFKENQNIAILGNKYQTAQKLLGDLKKSYMYLPKWMQQGVVEWNKRNIELENGCKIIASSTAADAIRGNTYNIIFLDEFAHVPAHLADDFFDSVYPTVSSGATTQVIIVSTPKGMNKYYQMWVGANHPKNSTDPNIQWNGYVPFSVNWRDVPKPDGKGLRDEAWKNETIARTSVEQFRQEFEVEFIGSGNTLISPEAFNAMTPKIPIRRISMKFSRFDTDGHTVEHFMDIHTDPVIGHQYVLCADVAGGKDQDASAFVIIDITSSPYTVVAKYKSNKLSPMLFPDVIVEGASRYNMAFVLVETNDNDVAKTLQIDLEYENLITTTSRGKGTQVGGGFTKNVEFGIRTNKSTKKIGCSNLKTLIEGRKLITHDYQIFVELTQFVSNTRGSYAAEEGANDDLAMCLVNFGWLINQKYFKELTDSDVYTQLKRDYDKALIEEEMFTFFVSSGTGLIGGGSDGTPSL